MSEPGCRLEKIPADYMIPGLDDTSLQTAIYANLPWAKGFHSVPQTDPLGGTGGVPFDNICHEDGYTTWSFNATGYNGSGYWGGVELTNSTSRFGEWGIFGRGKTQLYLYENLSGWMGMHRWGRKTVLGYGAILGLARMADKIRNDPKADASIKEDVNAYFNAMPYYINEELKKGSQGIAALAVPFGPEPSRNHAIGVYNASGVLDHNADVLAVLKALEDKARASGEYGNAEFAKVLRANYFIQILLVADEDGKAETWKKARASLAAIDRDRLVDVRQREFYDMVSMWFKTGEAYCGSGSYLAKENLECKPCNDGSPATDTVTRGPKISSPDGHGCTSCPEGTEPNESFDDCIFVASAKSCAGLDPSQDYDAATKACIDSAVSCAKQSLPFDAEARRCGAACGSNEDLKDGKCLRKEVEEEEEEE